MPRGKWFYIRSKMTGMVLDVEKENSSPGARVTVWEQKGGDNQQFFFHHYSNTIRCKLNGYCLDVAGGHHIVMNPFSEGVSRWRIEGDCLRELNTGKCLDINKASRDAGADLLVYDHHGKENQQWEMDKDLEGPFFYITSRMCPRVLDVCGGDCSAGTNVIMYTKKDDPQDNQLWYEDGEGYLRSKLNDFCLDSSEGDLCLKPFHGHDHQKWEVESEYVVNHHINKVLDIAENKDEDGARLVAWDNHGGENQKFYIVNA